MPNATTVPASEKQLFWITKLVDKKDISAEKRDEIKVALKRMNITKHLGSQYLNLLFDAADIPVAGAVTEEGFYLNFETNSAYKVKKAKASGKLYAQLVTAHGFKYIAGAIKELRADQKMTVEQICTYGLHTGICVNCAATLTDPISKFIGLGTKCGPTLMGKEAYSEAKKIAKADPQVAKELEFKKSLPLVEIEHKPDYQTVS